GGEFRYVLDNLQGQQKTGGAHQVLIPSDTADREPIDSENAASRLHSDLKKGTAYTKYTGQDFNTIKSGMSDWPIFASSWWPQAKKGLAARGVPGHTNQKYADLSEKDNLSPAEKYDLVFHPGQSENLPLVKNWSVEDMRKPESERGEPMEHPQVKVAGPATRW